MSKLYIISEERLLDLLEYEAELECLSAAGVDNWWGYCENKDEYIASALGISTEEVEEKELDFADVAEALLAEFQEYESCDCDNCEFGSMTGM